MDTAACRSCGARIVWAVTARGKRMPVDAAPAPNGNLVLRDRGGQRPPLTLGKAVAQPDEPLYVSHFATRPDAGQHRR